MTAKDVGPRLSAVVDVRHGRVGAGLEQARARHAKVNLLFSGNQIMTIV